MDDNYLKGSEWNKWDFHVHTPASFFWNGGKKLNEMSATEKTQSMKEFIDTVNSSEIEVFAVMDYWSFDWYVELKKYVTAHPGSLKKTVLPGMELRVECPVDYRLNIHILLSDNLTQQQLSDFKSALKIRIGTITKSISDECLIELAKSLDASKANHHGYADPAALSNEKLLELGSKTAEVTKDSLTASNGAFSQIPSGTGFIFLPYDTSDGLLKLDWATHPQDDNYFMQSAHIFESRDQRNVDLFNGKETPENKAFFGNFYKTIGSIPKPCVAGSDAHTFADYGKFPSSKATWIKSNPTFEGLKQIIYEPVDRVRIQELRPEEKALYSLIDKVEYKDSSGTKKIVHFNQNLNSIIGSRAQGKSNLLKNIVFSVDPKQCELRGVNSTDFLHLDSFKVYWGDGKVNTLVETETKERGILFIPQKYLGELIYEDNSRFDSFLINLFENNESFRNALSLYRRFEDNNVILITSILRELLGIRASAIDKQGKLKKLGKKEDYDKEILDIETKIKKFGKTTSITAKELKDYETLNSEKGMRERKKIIFDQDIKSFTELAKGDIISSERIYDLDFSNDSLSKLKNKLQESDVAFKEEFIAQEIAALGKAKIELQKEITALELKLKPLQDKVNQSKALLGLTDLSEKKKITRTQIEALGKELKKLKIQYEGKKSELVSAYLEFENQYSKIVFDLGDLKYSEVKLLISFDVSLLLKSIEDNVNYHNSLDFKKDLQTYPQANTFLSNPGEWSYSKKEFPVLIRELLDGILGGNLLTKSNRDVESVLMALFKNRFKIDLSNSVKSKKGNSFSEMSDGEQMLALLEFIFRFDDYNYPILLDQPEDDLDSKAISTTIVDFMKNEKAKRQIIIASHNANLVIGGDSEEVLISQKTGRSKPDFSYSSGAIENASTNKEIVEILEGGKTALKKRMAKLNVF